MFARMFVFRLSEIFSFSGLPITLKQQFKHSSRPYSVSHQEEIWGHSFSAVGLVFFLQCQPNVIDLYCFAHCLRCSFEQNTRKLIVYLSDTNNFLFLLFIFGTFFWALIMFENCHFQSRYEHNKWLF